MKYYILDVETTGVNPSFNEIIEISILRLEDRFQISKQIKACYPKRYNSASLKITGRKPEDLWKGAPKERVVEMIDNLILEDGLSPKERCIIAFVAHFDRNFCYNTWKSLNKTFLAENWLDAKSLARELAKKKGILKPKGLSLANSLQIAEVDPEPGSHTAQGDTRNTYHLVKKATDEYNLELISFVKSFPHKTEEKDGENWANLISFEDNEELSKELELP